MSDLPSDASRLEDGLVRAVLTAPDSALSSPCPMVDPTDSEIIRLAALASKPNLSLAELKELDDGLFRLGESVHDWSRWPGNS